MLQFITAKHMTACFCILDIICHLTLRAYFGIMDTLRAVYRFITWPVTQVVEKTVEVPIRTAGGGYAKLAGVLGATAIAALAYGAHGKFSFCLS